MIEHARPGVCGDDSALRAGADWRVALFLIAGAMVSTVFFALSPALQATRLELVRTIRGEVGRDARPGRARHVLIAMQVTASTLLLVTSAVFLRSAIAAAKFDPGIRVADTIMIDLNNERNRAALVQAIAAEPAVLSVAASWPDLLGRPRAALADVSGDRVWAAFKVVSPEYFDVLGLTFARGRGFTPSEWAPDAAVAVVSEKLAETLSPGGDVLGRVLHLAPDAVPA